MNTRYDVAAGERMSSPFEKQLCDHKQVTQYIFRMKDGDSKKSKSPNILLMPPSDCKMAEVPVQEDSPISDTTPISKSIIYGEDVIQSDFKKAAPCPMHLVTVK
jgi:hypothetical protein